MSELRGSTTLDSGALIEYLTGSLLGDVLKRYFSTLEPEETIDASFFTVAETFYVLCRIKGQEFAERKIAEILATKVINDSSSISIAMETGKLKCQRTTSLADCSCLAAAKHAEAKAFFAFEEDELLHEMKKK